MPTPIPAVSVEYAATGKSTKSDERGMRPMQARAYARRGEQYLIIKSPPASGKSRALMFIALHKLYGSEDVKQVIITVPERSIGASFSDEPLMKYGFDYNWHVEPKWNLCDASGGDSGKVGAVESFLASGDDILVCTHATFRFAVDKLGIEAFDNSLIAIDEFHHVSANPENRLGEHVRSFMSRDKCHMVAMTGSYFRGDAEAVMMPEDEARFDTVTYTYYEQLNGYEHLKQLDIGYYFYSGSYADEIMKVLDPTRKTIIHIPNVNSRESTGQKLTEVEHILHELGEWQGADPQTGFQLVKTKAGKVLRIADLVDDEVGKREKVAVALRDPSQKHNRDHVDIIIALGMAKEGFDWIWCEHALTVGYRSSLTEIIQIIGRATRDAPGKPKAQFTNLLAEPDASEEAVSEAVNDTLKAIAASLLMEQVLAPRFDFKPKNPQAGPTDGFDYGEDGYQKDKCNVGINPETGRVQVEVKGMKEPKSKEAQRICNEDLNEVIAAVVQDKQTLERGLFDRDMMPEEINLIHVASIVREKYPDLDEDDQEAVRQRAVAALTLVQNVQEVDARKGYNSSEAKDAEASPNLSLLEGVRKFALSVSELDIDLIDRINPFGQAYAVLSKTMNTERLQQIESIISGKRIDISLEEARSLAKRAVQFKKERGELPSLTSADPWERRMAEGVRKLQSLAKAQQNGEG